MTTYELISAIARESGLTQKQVKDCLRAFLLLMKDSLSNKGKISVKGLGTFKVITTKPRKGFNIQTKEQLDILPRKMVKFKMCPWLFSLNRFFKIIIL